jgi:hypothetical protein
MPALSVRGLFSSRTPMQHHVHPTLETTGLGQGFETFFSIDKYYSSFTFHQRVQA